MNKGSVYHQVEVIDYSFQGMGVVKLANFTIFVPFVKVGDVIDLEITELKKNYGFGEALNYKRAKVNCEYYYECGSCNLMHLTGSEQQNLKQQTLSNLIDKNMIHTQLEPFASSQAKVNYRNKVAMPVYNIDGKLRLGYYRRQSHNLIPIESCLLADEQLNALVKPIEDTLNLLGETAYNYRYKQGNIRHVILRGSQDNVMVTIATKSGKIKSQQLLVERLSQIPAIKSIIINHQSSPSRKILGPSNRVNAGEEQLTMPLNGLDFKVKPNAFFQVNREMTEQIFAYIGEIGDFAGKKILDAFCGTGTIGLSLAQSAHSVVGIEIDEEAVASARFNQAALEIDNAEFICGDIEQVISKVNDHQFDVAIVDPPRSGLATNMKQALVAMKPETVIYISCEPSTLMRDISELTMHYEVKSIKGFDMFPNTNHIETVAYLKLREEHHG
ncbi:23S rRNA (uracil(1939)-C(5))-methyltransferase RlmD [Mollicutes bacterium LVI A0039]|nr:23S rRNA (uracil(1939)-C(5))-methyltransferase RlmD [Mollicutes bacterium LVI A0039]